MKKDYTYIAGLVEQLPEIPTDSIISRNLYSDEHLKVVLFGFAPGQELSEHTSAMRATLHILSGTATLTLGDDTLEAGPGTWVHMEPRLPHSVRAGNEPVTMLLMMVKAARE
jgi:quercetin dioxygenase-like cupin family protein